MGGEHGDGVERSCAGGGGGSETTAKNLGAQSLHNVHNPEQKSYCGTAPVYVVRGVLVQEEQ
jgi:hypothetical protein